MKTAKAVNLVVLFLLELAVLGAVLYWGITRGGTIGLIFGIGGAGLLAELWGLLASPRARFKLHGTARLVFEVLWFGAGAAALYAAGAHAWAAVLALVCVASKCLAQAREA
ncbi:MULTISPECIES: YrdB family protein [unclassified Streptomyces]|uniref:YrdB family protein n=1 Tax=unclassified Streptomyces TaxID=2593676 RepID=UPI00117D002D|nr:YrdB family protein [Streptomyces sp. 1-11]